jgi:hypothetical protein
VYEGDRGCWDVQGSCFNTIAARRYWGAPTKPDPSLKRIAALERELARAAARAERAERAEAIVELQKKFSQLLGLALPTPDERTATP